MATSGKHWWFLAIRAPDPQGRIRLLVASEVACSSVKGGQQKELYNMAMPFDADAK